MSPKEPVLLVVLIETRLLRWSVAGVRLTGEPIPLIRSSEGNLSSYREKEPDEQVSFLRHRLAGVLQRGTDRLWGQTRKPCQIVFVADGPFPEGEADLGRRVGQNFVDWMSRPPVVYGESAEECALDRPVQLEFLAGSIDGSYCETLGTALPRLWELTQDETKWELAPERPTA